jgi:molybdenum cofactor guanylyltransferase
MIEPQPEHVTGVILAGGRGRRMGGTDKGLIELAGRPLVEHVLDRLRPQVGGILINANRHHARYARYGHPVIGDGMADYQGPLAGFAAAMANAPSAWVLTVPCDGPWLSFELLRRLAAALVEQQAELAVAHDGVRLQPVYALLAVTLADSLAEFLAAGDRKIDLWYAKHRMAKADFSDVSQSFRNLNTPDECQRLASLSPS